MVNVSYCNNTPFSDIDFFTPSKTKIRVYLTIRFIVVYMNKTFKKSKLSRIIFAVGSGHYNEQT